MDNINKAWLLGIGVIITCLVISLGYMNVREAQSLSSASATRLNEYATELSESDINKYHGLEVNGSDVINLIKKSLGDYRVDQIAPVYITVTTSTSVTTHTNSSNIESIQNFTHNMYIKPIAKFTGKVVKDVNEVIIGIEFQQK